MIYDVLIRKLSVTAMLDIKGRLADIQPRLQRLGLTSPPPGRASSAYGVEVFCVAAEHWLVRAPLTDEDTILSSLLFKEPAPDTLILAVSDAYSFFEITGADARQVVVIASPLDVHATAFPEDGATFTEAFGQKALLVRKLSGFDLAVDSSLAPMMASYFSRITGGG
ncbi:MAG: hypothetical protein H7228_03630 [Polaromonas sp.]|nr:hypothetical protein [Polaromonas sp.]